MDLSAVQRLRALLAMLNQQNVSREVDQLFWASTSSTPSGNTSVTVSTPFSYNHGSYFTNSSRDKKHRVTLQLKWRSVWGRGWNRLCPYASVRTQFARVVILLGDPTEEDVPRGRARAVICDAQCEAPVAIRTGITSQEERPSCTRFKPNVTCKQ